MPKIDERIRDIDKTICQNIDLIDFETVSRALVSQNLLSQSRNLVEHVAVKAYADAKGEDLEADWETIPAATEYIKHHNKFQFLRKFHNFLQESKSHYTPDGEGAERLVLKYYKFYMILRNFVKQEYQMDILHNLEKFPINTDHAVQEYHDKIAERLELRREIRDLTHNPRMYVHKVVPFVSGEAVYYEIVLTPAYDTTSKFDRFVCYSKIMIPSHYSAKMDIYYETIEVNGRKMPVNILTDFMVSIRPCELNNFAKIFGDDIKMSPSHSEYIGMMQYLSNSGASLLDIVTAPRDIYNPIKQKMFGKSQVHYFENVLDKCRRLIRTKGAGSTTVRYLLHTLNNKVIKNQLGSGSCWKLSDLYLDWGCIPFDQMPFATSLRQHNPESAELFGSLSADNRKHEFVARYMLSNAYVFEADLLISNPKIITKYHYTSDFLAIKKDRTDDWCFIVKDGVIVEEKVGGLDCWQMVGISYWNEEDGHKLSDDIKMTYEQPGGKERYWEQVPLVFCQKHYKVEVRECQENDIIEIDTFRELKAIDKTYDV